VSGEGAPHYPQTERRDAYAKRAKLHEALACNLADLMECAVDKTREGWCSACFVRARHRKVDAGLSVPTYLLYSMRRCDPDLCGPQVLQHATRGFGQARIPR
jgi:hypothetical protein